MNYQPHETDRFEVNMSDVDGTKTRLSILFTILCLIAFVVILIQVINIAAPIIISRETEKNLVDKYNLDRMFKGQESLPLTGFVKNLVDLKYKIKVSVVKSKEINAYCSFGDRLMITNKLLNEIESENELAFILAHEAGHSYYRHNTKGLFFKVIYRSTFGLLGFSAPGGNMSDLSYSRKLENQADDFAIKALNRYYGHTNGAADFFDRVSSKNVYVSWWSKLFERFYSTHPITSERIENINKSSLDTNGKVVLKSDSAIFKAIDVIQ